MTALLEEISARPKAPDPLVAKAIRRRAGVTQQRLADELRVHRVTVAHWEDGTRRPRGELLTTYLAVLAALDEVS